MTVELFISGTVVGLLFGVLLFRDKYSNTTELPESAKSEWDVKRIRSAFDKRGRGFEMLIAKYFSLNYDSVEMTQKTRDGGYDVIAKNSSKKILIEAKMTSGSVEAETARAITGVGTAKNADEVLIITTSDLSKDGKEHIEEFNKNHQSISARVIDGEQFCKLLNESELQPPWHHNSDP